MNAQRGLLALLLCLTGVPTWAQSLPTLVSHEAPNLVETYKGIHSHPELSHHEEHTSALLAGELHRHRAHW
jgi:metal-dependent amidase/aminoacylase/carboxypeptidase family protein